MFVFCYLFDIIYLFGNQSIWKKSEMTLTINFLLLMKAFLLNYSLHGFELPITRPPDVYANQRHFCFSPPISDTSSEIRDFQFPFNGNGIICKL